MGTAEEFWAAVRTGDEHRVRSLVAADAGLASARDAQGVSAVLAAAYAGHPGIALALAEAGAELNLFESAVVGERSRVTALLEEDPAAAGAFSPDGFTALHLTAFFGQVEVMEELLRWGADVNATARNGTRVRPIHSAAAHRNGATAMEMVRRLVEHGAETDVAQEGGWTPLHQAAAHGESRLIEYLLRHGADPAARSTDGRTPLDMARNGGHEEAAALLQARSGMGSANE